MNVQPHNLKAEEAPLSESETPAAAQTEGSHQPRPPRKGWHTQPGSIAALLLILAALIILSAWLTSEPGDKASAPTPTATALNAPQLALEEETAEPTATATAAVLPTEEQARTEVITYTIQ